MSQISVDHRKALLYSTWIKCVYLYLYLVIDASKHITHFSCWDFSVLPSLGQHLDLMKKQSLFKKNKNKSGWCSVGYIDNQWGDKLCVSDAQRVCWGPGLVHCHLFWVMSSRTRLLSGISGQVVTAQHGERWLSEQINTGVCTVVPARAWRLGQVFWWTPCLVKTWHCVACASWLCWDLWTHECRERVLIGGGHWVHSAVARARTHSVGGGSALGVAWRSVLRVVCTWSRRLEYCLLWIENSWISTMCKAICQRQMVE